MEGGDTDTYVVALDEFRALFPDDENLAFQMVDVAILRKDEELLMRSYEGMQRWTGGDPWINVLTAKQLERFGSPLKAHAVLSQAGDVDFGTQDAHAAALKIALKAEDHGATLRHLQRLRDQYGAELDHLPGTDGWSSFAKSEQYDAWIAD